MTPPTTLPTRLAPLAILLAAALACAQDAAPPGARGGAPIAPPGPPKLQGTKGAEERPMPAPSDTGVTSADVNASIEAVWSAFTTKRGLESWMVPVADIDLKVGGLVRTHVDPDADIGDENTIVNRILAFQPPRMISLAVERVPDSFPDKES